MAESRKVDDIYERLANALDALPHRFARTASGMEIGLIRMAFTEEEVWLAGHLTRFPETATEIAGRVGRDVADVTATLEKGRSVVDRDKCIGCGVCVISCGTDAIRMEPVSEDEWFHVPASMAEWEEMRLRTLAQKGNNDTA